MSATARASAMSAAARAMSAVRDVIASVTVEPVLFLFMLGSFMEYTAFQSLIYAKVCQVDFSQYVCDNLDLPKHKSQLDEVQSEASYWMLYSNVALALPAMISAIYIGTWSDIFGRKMPLLLPPLGQILSALIFMASSAYPPLPIGYIVVANGLAGLLGGFSSEILAAMSYISAVTSVHKRTVRVGLLESMTFVGGLFGPLLGSLVFEHAGRTWTFCALVVINAIIVVYVVLAVRDVPPPHPPLATTSVCGWLAQVFSLRYLLDAVRTALKPRAGSRRAYILALLAASLVIMLNTSGQNDVMYLYVKDAPLQLPDQLYDYYFSAEHAVGAATLLFGMPLLRRYRHTSDTALCGLGLTSKVLGLIWLAFAVNNGMLFVGRIFSLVTVVESLCTLLGSLIYNGVYPATRRWLHGLVFVLGAATLLVPALLVLAVHGHMRRAGLLHTIGAPAEPLDTLAESDDSAEGAAPPERTQDSPVL